MRLASSSGGARLSVCWVRFLYLRRTPDIAEDPPGAGWARALLIPGQAGQLQSLHTGGIPLKAIYGRNHKSSQLSIRSESLGIVCFHCSLPSPLQNLALLSYLSCDQPAHRTTPALCRHNKGGKTWRGNFCLQFAAEAVSDKRLV